MSPSRTQGEVICRRHYAADATSSQTRLDHDTEPARRGRLITGTFTLTGDFVVLWLCGIGPVRWAGSIQQAERVSANLAADRADYYGIA